jgi:hypothetical protein
MRSIGPEPRSEGLGDRPPSRPRLWVGLLAALFICAAPALAQATESTTIVEERPPVEPTSATVGPSFVPDRLGANAIFTLKFSFRGGPEDVPSAVRKSVLHLPLGLQLSANHIATCSRAKLMAHGAKGCSPDSQIGQGKALTEIELGALPENENVTLWAFIGPFANGNPTIEILAQGITPLEKRVVITGEVLPDNPPYGNKLVVNIPPIPTIPLEPDASTLSFSLTIGTAKHGANHASAAVTIPRRCPAGGFPFLDEFAFADGTDVNAHFTSSCP